MFLRSIAIQEKKKQIIIWGPQGRNSSEVGQSCREKASLSTLPDAELGTDVPLKNPSTVVDDLPAPVAGYPGAWGVLALVVLLDLLLQIVRPNATFPAIERHQIPPRERDRP